MEASQYDGSMAELLVKMGTNGRFVLPVEVRRALGVADGGTLVVRLVDDEVRLSTPAAAVRRAQRAVRPYLQGRSLSDELLADRRAEAAGE
jgi:bifunctional DNA-binding transcriptional regulator/antitoxin component of YhaV-PrlF toxin-antitoxin module